jgi:hypothetical protein
MNGQGGGGIFESRTKILLDHHDWEGIEVEEGFSVPDWLNAGLPDRRGGGEDFDLGSRWSLRLQRDGWELMQHPTKTKDEFGPRMRLELDPPFVWQKTHPIRSDDYAIQMSFLGIGGQNRPPIGTEHRLVGTNGYLGQMGESDWADWAPNGDLLFAQPGCLFRLRREDGKFGPIEQSKSPTSMGWNSAAAGPRKTRNPGL